MNQAAFDYASRAQIHKPRDQAALAREAKNLADRGLTYRDIGALMQLSEAAVRELLEKAA